MRNKEKQNLKFESKDILKEKKIQVKWSSKLSLCHFLSICKLCELDCDTSRHTED